MSFKSFIVEYPALGQKIMRSREIGMIIAKVVLVTAPKKLITKSISGIRIATINVGIMMQARKQFSMIKSFIFGYLVNTKSAGFASPSAVKRFVLLNSKRIYLLFRAIRGQTIS